MYSPSTTNFEFVPAEPKITHIIIEVPSPSQNANPVLTITDESLSIFLFYTHILLSIYLLYIFQRAVIRHHKVLFTGSSTRNVIALFVLNHNAIYIHCLWDSILRYLLNTRLGLPYGILFFYPVPRSLLEMFPRWIFPNPTSEGLDFWTKFLLVLIGELAGFIISKLVLPSYEARQERQSNLQATSTDAHIQVQARVNDFAGGLCFKTCFDDLLGRYQEVIDGSSRGEAGDEAGSCEKGGVGSDYDNTFAEFARITLDDGDSYFSAVYYDMELASALQDVIRITLNEGKNWRDARERKAGQANTDTVGEQDCRILQESIFMEDFHEVNVAG